MTALYTTVTIRLSIAPVRSHPLVSDTDSLRFLFPEG